MARRFPQGMFYRRGSYWCTVRTASGKRRQVKLSKHFDVAEKIQKRLQTQVDFAAHGEGEGIADRVKLADLCAEYLLSLATRATPGYLSNIERSLRVVQAHLSVKFVDQITPAKIHAVEDALLRPDELDGRPKGLSHSTVNFRVGALGDVLRWAKRLEKIRTNVMDHWKKLAQGGRHARRKRRRLSVNECEILLKKAREVDEKWIRGIPQSMFIEVILATGFRVAEAASLRWRDLTKSTANGRRTWWLTVRTAYTKTGDERANPIPESLAKALLRLRKVHRVKLKRITTATDHILLSPGGKPLTTHIERRNRLRWLDRIAASSGIGKRTEDGRSLDFHALRHTYCTILQERGVPLDIASELMGHKSIQLTRQIYTESRRLPRATVADLLPEFSAATASSKPRSVGRGRKSASRDQLDRSSPEGRPRHRQQGSRSKADLPSGSSSQPKSKSAAAARWAQ